MQYGTNPFTGRWEEARYFYEIYVPRFDVPTNKKGYTILLRLLNPSGLPVTEEQEILVQAPKNYEQLVPAGCWAVSEPDQTAAAPTTESQVGK